MKPTRQHHWLCVAVAALVCTSPAFSGTVHGVLRVPATQNASMTSFNPYPGTATAMCGMHTHPRGLPTDAVVYLEGVPEGADSLLPDAHPRLTQKDQAFVPRVVVVPRGGSVEFPNMDPIFHNVFSVSPTKRFDLGKYPRPKSKAVVFGKTGLVKVYCDIHSDMEGFVLVLPDRFFCQPSASGEYSLPDVPAGSYQVHVWHPDFPEFRRDVSVPAQGDVSLNLSW